MIEKLFLALIMTLCLNLLVVVRLANNPDITTSSRPAEDITPRNKWLEPISSNGNSTGCLPSPLNRAKGEYTQKNRELTIDSNV